MKECSTGSGKASRVTWESLKAFGREGIQKLLHRALEEEVSELLGPERYERCWRVDAPRGCRRSALVLAGAAT